VLLPALALAVVTALTKIATGYWAARRAGISLGGRWRAGGALVARGEFSIVIAGLAVTAGIEPSLGPLATAYVLILVVLGPLTARYTQPLAERLTTRFGGRFGGRFGVTPERRDVAERPPEAEAGTEPERAGEARQQTAVPD
jgi:CPA2 family monovalent cation:H+ antiporter-2